MAKPRKRRWTIASARQRLPKLIAMAAREPQAVYRRDKLVAAVVSPEIKQEMDAAGVGARGASLAAALAELHRICAEDEYSLVAPRRIDRKPKRDRR
jgi:hypothetical protein